MDALTILLPSLNGARFIDQQLKSLAWQTHLPSQLIVSDDGSHDSTLEEVNNFAKHAPFPVNILQGPSQGLGANTLHLLQQTSENQHIAFCDQDDVWFPEKLNRAIAAFSQHETETPVLFCSRSVVTDCALNPVATTKAPLQNSSFENALVQCLAPANTTVLNAAAAKIARDAANDSEVAPSLPDWWIYQLITGAGGTVIFDEEPLLFYRQHDENLIGACHGTKARLWRVYLLFNGTYRQWRLEQTERLAASSHRLTPSAQNALDHVLSGNLPKNSMRQSRAEQTLIRVAWHLGVA